MELEELKLTRGELPILYEDDLQIPIHPKLLESSVTLPEDLAARVFPKTVEEWFEGLKEYRSTADLDELTEKWYDRVLLEKPRIESEDGRQVIQPINWSGDYTPQENGFAQCLSINKGFGGSLYFSEKKLECQNLLSPKGEPRGYIRFSSKKTREFGFKEETYGDETLIRIYKYGHHNANHYSGTLFLRNWAINYMNKAFEFIAD